MENENIVEIKEKEIVKEKETQKDGFLTKAKNLVHKHGGKILAVAGVIIAAGAGFIAGKKHDSDVIDAEYEILDDADSTETNTEYQA